jgi:hypothetical protein
LLLQVDPHNVNDNIIVELSDDSHFSSSDDEQPTTRKSQPTSRNIVAKTASTNNSKMMHHYFELKTSMNKSIRGSSSKKTKPTRRCLMLKYLLL